MRTTFDKKNGAQAERKKLEKERPNWREDTVVMLDNATYHRSAATLKVLEALRVPLLFTGPHSYTAAPCELLFAGYKSADTNPNRVKTGKSHFKEVVQLAIKRFQQIPKPHRLLYWHHCLMEAYKYLVFEKL